MRTCDNCGAQVPDGDSFCGVCGAFVAWEDETAAPPGRETAGEIGESGGDDLADRAGEPPVAVQPARPIAPRPVVREFEAPPDSRPAHVICPVCATPNEPGRRFCRRCGSELAAASGQPERLSWWTRLRLWWRQARGRPKTLVRRLLTLLLVVAVLLALGYVAVAYGGRAIDAVRDRIANPVPVRPRTVTASSAAAGHPPEAVIDGLANRYWAPDRGGPPEGQFVELTFDPPIRLLDVIVHIGLSGEEGTYPAQARPAELTLETWTAEGHRTEGPIRLEDQPGAQRFHHVAGDVVRARFTIRSCFGVVDGHDVALAEIEPFKRP